MKTPHHIEIVEHAFYRSYVCTVCSLHWRDPGDISKKCMGKIVYKHKLDVPSYLLTEKELHNLGYILSRAQKEHPLAYYRCYSSFLLVEKYVALYDAREVRPGKTATPVQSWEGKKCQEE